MLQVWLLGQFEIRLDGRRVVLSARAAQSLLAYLMLSAGTPHRREKLAGLFWSELPEENARRNLRHEVWRIRKALVFPVSTSAEYLLADDYTLAFNRDSEYWLDATQFQRPETDLESLAAGLALYRGELLPGMYDDWISLEREHLQVVFENKMQALLESLIEAKRWNTVIEWSERWIAQGQSPEPAYRALMVAYAATGNRAQIAVTYERCRDALRNDLGVEPSDETTQLCEQLVQGQRVGHVDLAPMYFAHARLPVHEEPPAPGEPPFKGLEYFDEQDAELFYGREELTAKLTAALRASKFLAVVVGASGSGKSSVVRAGVVPALKKGVPLADGTLPPPDSQVWKTYIFTPAAHPLEGLATALTRDRDTVTATAMLAGDLAKDPRALHLYLRIMRSEPSPNAPRSIVHDLLVIDQFEELFTLCREEFEREAFIDNLLTALSTDDEGLLTVMLTIRADFYAHLAQYPELREAVAKHQEFIGPMTSDELRRAIEEPAKQKSAADGAAWEFEPGLVDLILRDVGDEPGALPLLSHALLETWRRRSGHRMTLKGYHDAGGVRGAIAQTAETTYQQLSPEQQAIARNIFMRLTQLGEGTEDTRRRASFDELVPKDETASSVHSVLLRLADARLITLHADSAEVAHEALIREWPQLREWLNQDRDGLRLHRQVTEAAQEWELLERDPGALYRGARLVQASEWANANPTILNADERAFLEASQAQEQKEEQEKEAQRERELEQAKKLAETESRGARRLRWFAAGLAVLLLAALGAAWFAFNQSNVAESNFIAGERIRLASQAQLALDNGEGGDVPALLALQSLKHGYSPEADASLLNALQRGFTRQVYVGHTGLVWSAVFSPDGRKMVTSSNDGSARVWDVESGKELAAFAPSVRILDTADFAPDGRYVLTGGPGEVARLWDTQTGQEVRQFAGHIGGVWFAQFSNDGKYALTSDDKGARLWDVETGQQIRAFIGHTVNGVAAMLSSDGHFIVTGARDGVALLWDVASGKELRRFELAAAVFWVEFSPDGKSLLTISGNSAQLWDTQSGKEIRRFIGNTGDVIFGTFSADGKYLATGGADRTARLWDVATGKELKKFIGHTGGVFSVEFSPDGRYLLTGSEDQTARLWDIRSESEPHLIGTRGGGNVSTASSIPASLSPDSQLLLYGFNDSSAEAAIWNTQTGESQLHPFEGVTNLSTLSAYAFSPDDHFLLGGGDDGVVWLWDTQTGKLIHKLPGHTGPVRNVIFSPDGRSLLSGSDDKTARVWDAQTGMELQELAGHAGAVRAVAFSPDGKVALTGSDDKTARIWDVQTGKELRQLVGHGAPLRALAFSPDGKLIVTGGDDESARLWDAQTGRELRQFVGHTAPVSQVAFSPDGHYILTGSADQTARLWNVDTGMLLRNFVGHISPVLYIGFADNGSTVITGDTMNVYRWRATLAEVTAFACEHLTRDLTADERALYRISDNDPTCAHFTIPVNKASR